MPGRDARNADNAPIFSDAERAYLNDVHPMARLATVGPDGAPHVMPLGMYWIDQQTDDIVTSGKDLAHTKKWRDVQRTHRAAIVVDDVQPPFRPRGIEVRGRAEVVDDEQPRIVIHPQRVVAWGLEQVPGQR